MCRHCTCIEAFKRRAGLGYRYKALETRLKSEQTEKWTYEWTDLTSLKSFTLPM